MEIKFAGKTYFLPDVCASNNRQKAKALARSGAFG